MLHVFFKICPGPATQTDIIKFTYLFTVHVCLSPPHLFCKIGINNDWAETFFIICCPPPPSPVYAYVIRVTVLRQLEDNSSIIFVGLIKIWIFFSRWSRKRVLGNYGGGGGRGKTRPPCGTQARYVTNFSCNKKYIPYLYNTDIGDIFFYYKKN